VTACTHGMPTPASCRDCMEDGNLPLPPREADLPVVRARFARACPACDYRIEIGDEIVATATEGWLHEGCS
jgi:hypothetical protein